MTDQQKNEYKLKLFDLLVLSIQKSGINISRTWFLSYNEGLRRENLVFVGFNAFNALKDEQKISTIGYLILIYTKLEVTSLAIRLKSIGRNQNEDTLYIDLPFKNDEEREEYLNFISFVKGISRCNKKQRGKISAHMSWWM